MSIAYVNGVQYAQTTRPVIVITKKNLKHAIIVRKI